MPDNNLLSFKSNQPARPDALGVVPTKLRDARLAQQLTQTELADRVGIARQAISAYEQGTKKPEADTITRIGMALNQSLGYFTSEDAPVFGGMSTRFFRAFGPKTKRRNLACEVFGKWLTQTATYFDGFVNFPPLKLPQVPTSPVPDGRFSEDEIEAVALLCRRAWGLGLGPISNVVSLLEANGIVVCRFAIPNDTIEAFSFWSGDRAFVFLASQKESAVRSRFDAAHELGHLLLHRGIGDEELEDDPTLLKVVEREANLFAGAFLLPTKSFASEVFTTRLDAFVSLKQRWKVAIQAMVYRCREIGIIDEDQFTNLYKQISARRMRTKEPLDDIFPMEEPKLLNRAAALVLSSGLKTPDDVSLELQINPRDIEQICNLPVGTLASTREPEEFRPTLKNN